MSIVFFVAKEKRPMWRVSERYKRWNCRLHGIRKDLFSL